MKLFSDDNISNRILTSGLSRKWQFMAKNEPRGKTYEIVDQLGQTLY